jgi:hypothetical protein
MLGARGLAINPHQAGKGRMEANGLQSRLAALGEPSETIHKSCSRAGVVFQWGPGQHRFHQAARRAKLKSGTVVPSDRSSSMGGSPDGHCSR